MAWVDGLAPIGVPVVVGLDDTIERRRGPKIAARGIYRDPVRSSKGLGIVKASGLRWISLQLTCQYRGPGWVWSLPFRRCWHPRSVTTRSASDGIRRCRIGRAS